MSKPWVAGEELPAADLNKAIKFGGDGSDGALSVPSGTTTVDLLSAQVVVLNYSAINIALGATLDFSNPHANGTVIIIKCQGECIIAGTLDASGLGSDGGAGGAAVSDSGAGIDGSHGISSSFIFSIGNYGGRGGDAPPDGNNNADASVGGLEYSGSIFYRTQAFKSIIVSPGSGGGGGASGNESSGGGGGFSGAGGGGSKGGGALYLEVYGAYNATGIITVAGVGGLNGGDASAIIDGGGGGGGGGGAGGDILVLYNELTADSATYTISGGGGGSGGSGDGVGVGYTGGGGGAGGGNSTENGDGGSGVIKSTKTGGTGGDGADGTATRELNTDIS